MTAEPLADTARPRLPRGVRLRRDDVRGEWMLVAPERVVRANPTAVSVLERCTGESTVSEIVDDLARTFAADRQQVETDVRQLLAQLRLSGLVEL